MTGILEVGGMALSSSDNSSGNYILAALLITRGDGDDALKLLNVEKGALNAETYAPRVRMRGVEDPKSHNFPYSFDKEILSTTPIPKKNGYNIFQREGTMNGKAGVYEMGKTKDGIIDHRFFKPNKK